MDELAECCDREGISLLPYSPLGGGVLTGKYNDGKLPKNARFSEYFKAEGRQKAMAERFVNPRAEENTKFVHQLAADLGVDPVTFSICLLYTSPSPRDA